MFVFAQDFTVFGGSLSETNAAKIVKIMDTAMRVGAPVIGLNDSGGARIQEGVRSLAGYADIFLRNVLASGVVPQISAIMGPCAGGAVYSPAMTDFILMVREHVVHVHHRAGGHQGSHPRRGHEGRARRRHDAQRQVGRGALPGARRRRVPAAWCASCSASCRRTTSKIRRAKPVPTRSIAPTKSSTPSFPPRSNQPYDIKDVINRVVDDGYFFEVQEHYAKNIVIGFARLNGKPVGIVANQPAFLAGVLDIDASIKGARFVRFCDCFNIPLITFEDVPGFLPGTQQEYGGIITHGAKLLYAFSEATVPKITVITRKAYGGAYCVMASKHIRTDVNYAWPTAEIAVMGPEGAVNIVYKRELEKSENHARRDRKPPKIEEFRERFANPYVAAERGYLDAVIRPRDTREKLIQALEMLDEQARQEPAEEAWEYTAVGKKLSAVSYRSLAKSEIREASVPQVRYDGRDGRTGAPSKPVLLGWGFSYEAGDQPSIVLTTGTNKESRRRIELAVSASALLRTLLLL